MVPISPRKEFVSANKRRFLQSSRQCFASNRGKQLIQVTVASCGAMKLGSLPLRAPGTFSTQGAFGLVARAVIVIQWIGTMQKSMIMLCLPKNRL
jgi:hypothetical protein